MKILCISDQIDPLVYNASIKERFGDVDLVISAGDLPLDYLDFIVSNLNKPLLFVFGNHDLKDFHHFKGRSMPHSIPSFGEMANEEAPPCTGAIHVGSRVWRESGLLFAGLGGSMQYNQGENQFSDLQMYLEVIKLIPALLVNRVFRGRFVDILITHASPKGIHDKDDRCHWGFKAFLWFMRAFKPRYLIHGHIHLYDLSAVRVTRYEQTVVINAYSQFVLDTDAEAAASKA
ncbi:MAG: metallophosphoesterase [Treponema sp.]|jgi:Icc-related predicted phosphoesterase|nr:metallophosphoesterase [Treponema sp.]